MVTKKSWDEFRDSGFIWWINQILHTFGWAIVTDVDSNGKVVDAYPARVKFRGFSEESQERGYKRVSKYIDDNSEELLKEASE